MVLRPLLQEAFNGPQPVGDAFDVVLSVNAQPQDTAAVQAQLPGEAKHFRFDFRSAGFGVDAVEINADWDGTNQRGLVAIVHPPAVGVNLGVKIGIDAVEEIPAIARDMKTEQVVSQHPVQDVILPGADAEDVRVGPGDVPELADDSVLIGFADVTGEQGQMVVLDEDNGRVVVDFVEHQVGEAPVDGLVAVVMLRVEYRLSVGDMTERPKPLVSEPAVVTPVLILTDVEQAHGVSRGLVRDWNASPGVHYLTVGRAAALGNPGAAAGAHQRVNGGSETAGGHFAVQIAVLVNVENVGLTVGNYDESIVAQIPFDQTF